MIKEKKLLTPRLILTLLIFIIGVPMLPLLISWQWDWWEAWVYFSINVGGFLISRILARQKNPDLLAERGKLLQHENPEPWDKILSLLVGIGGGLVPLVVGLEARFGPELWLPLWVRLIALTVFVAGYALGSYALIANRYFSGMVRIQSDRDHRVITSGPYQWVRHPGYAGALLSYLSVPLLLESIWAFMPVGLLFVILILRSALEDQVLQEKLPGYEEYADDVRYRLIPGIW